MPALILFATLGAALVVMSLIFPEIFRSLFQDKFAGDTSSGKIRLEAFAGYSALFAQFNPINWLFGVGFGYTYYSLAWSLTANIGLLGDAVALFAFLKPIIFLTRDPLSEALRMSLISTLVVIALTLSESFIPITWMLLGLAYWQLDRQRQEAWLSAAATESGGVDFQTEGRPIAGA